MKLPLLFAACLFLAACSSNVRQTSADAGTKFITGRYTNSIYLPSDYNPAKKYPLVFCLLFQDPFTEIAAGFANSRKVIFIVSPNWSPEVYAYATNRYSIDTERVYATGWSAGGAYTYETAEWRPDIFAAVNPMLGGLSEAFPDTNRVLLCSYFFDLGNLAHLPIRHTPESSDFINSAMFNNIKNVLAVTGNTNMYIAYTDSIHHDGPGVTSDFDKMLDFFLKHTRVRYPERFTWSNYRPVDTMYYLHDIVCRPGGTVYRIYSAVSNGALNLEVYGIESFSVAESDYRALGCTNANIVVNGVALPVAPHLSGGVVRLPVEDPFRTDGLRRDAEQAAANLTVRSLKSVCLLSNLNLLACDNVYRASIADPAKPLILKVNFLQDVRSVVIDGKPAKFGKLWNTASTEQYYRIEMPAGTGNGPDTVMEIVTAGAVPLMKNDVPFEDYVSMGLVPFNYEFAADDLVPLPVSGVEPFDYEISFDIYSADARDGLFSTMRKSSRLSSPSPITRTAVSSGCERYTLQGTYNPARPPELVYMNPCFFSTVTAGEGMTVEWDAMFRPCSYPDATNFIRRESDTLRSVLGNPGKVLFVTGYRDSFSDSQMNNIFWNTYNQSARFARLNVLKTYSGKPVTSHQLNAFLLTASEGHAVYADNGVFSADHLMSQMGGTRDLDLTASLIYWMSDLVTAFIPEPAGNTGVSFEQTAFRWALRKYLAYSALYRDGFLLPHQYCGYSDGVMKSIAGDRQDRIPLSRVTNFMSAYRDIPSGEMILLYLERYLGREAFYSFIDKHHEALLSSDHPFGLMQKFLKSDFGAGVRLDDLEKLAVNGFPDLNITTAVSPSGSRYRVAVTVRSAADVPVPVEIAFYTNGYRASSVWETVAAGTNRFTATLDYRPSSVFANDLLVLLESSASGNYSSNGDDLEPLRAVFRSDLTDYVTNSVHYHRIVTAENQRPVRAAYREAEADGDAVEVVRVLPMSTNQWIAVTRIGKKTFALVFRKKDGAIKMIDGWKL